MGKAFVVAERASDGDGPPPYIGFSDAVPIGTSWDDSVKIYGGGDLASGIQGAFGLPTMADVGGPIFNAQKNLAAKICGLLPSGSVLSAWGNGNFVGTAGSIDLVTNFRTGEITSYFSPGYFVGPTKAGASVTSEYTFGNLGTGNTNFEGGFTGVFGGWGYFTGAASTSSGGPAKPLSGIKPKAPGHVTTVAGGVQTPGRGGAAYTTFSLPLAKLGKYWTIAMDPQLIAMFAANQVCAKGGF